jgi:hypothetical protein
MDLNNIFNTIFEFVSNFLKQNNLWDTAVSIYNESLKIFSTIWGWIDKNNDLSKWIDYLIQFIKFVIKILLTLLEVLIKIGNWILGLFK